MLLDVKPSIEYKAKLQEVLHTSNKVFSLQNWVIMGMQTQTVL